MAKSARRGATVRVARWSATHPWWAIITWLVLVAGCFVVGNSVGTKSATQVDLGVGESGRATQMIDNGKFNDPDVENLLITPRSGNLDMTVASAAAAAATSQIRQQPNVTAVDTAVPAPNGQALLVPITIAGDADTAYERVDPIVARAAAVQAQYPQLRIEVVGPASITAGFNQKLSSDAGKATMISLPVTLLILLVAFGTLLAAGVPVLLGLSAVGATMGLWAVASQVVPDSGIVPQVIILMGMAVGVDYSLFYLRREREERRRGAGKVDAVELAAATSGRAVLVSGFAVIVSMVSLYLAGDIVFSGMATGAILVVAVAMVGSLTVLPAVLGKLGNWVDRLRVPVLWRLSMRGGESRVWPVLLRPALRLPALTLLVSVAGLLVLASPALHMKLKSTSFQDFPRSIPVMQAYDRLTAAYPSKGTQYVIAVEAATGQQPAVRSALSAAAQQISSNSLFAHDESPQLETSTNGRVTRLTVATPYAADSSQAERALKVLRNEVLPTTVAKVGGAQYGVTGDVAESVDYTKNLRDKLPQVVGFVLLLTLIIMTVTFRSIVIGLTAIIINLLSTVAAYGALVLIFQRTWAENLLNFHSTGTIVAWMPLFLFVVLFGLSMDYHVFVVSRIREAAASTASTREAVGRGITQSAGVVTSAAVVMVSVFSIFAGLSMIETKQLGVGLAVAVLVDALVIRIVVLPSLMVLLGRANWWPSKLSRRNRQRQAPVADGPDRRLDSPTQLTR